MTSTAPVSALPESAPCLPAPSSFSYGVPIARSAEPACPPRWPNTSDQPNMSPSSLLPTTPSLSWVTRLGVRGPRSAWAGYT